MGTNVTVQSETTEKPLYKHNVCFYPEQAVPCSFGMHVHVLPQVFSRLNNVSATRDADTAPTVSVTQMGLEMQ